MLFVTRFQISPDIPLKDKSNVIEWEQKKRALEMGKLIEGCFPFQQEGSYPEGWELRIQAFPQEKWQQFKDNLKVAIETMDNAGMTTLNLILIGKILHELETFGNPQKTDNQQP